MVRLIGALMGNGQAMKSLIHRAQQVGLARAICVLLLFALVPLRLADPRPLQELRTRTFDFFQVLRPR
ncbi:MAG: hypothetical protein J2P55_15365, partial [Rhizobiales bacterium]|nr:hypothetical protein [Hyphomicrobiales bacterium]